MRVYQGLLSFEPTRRYAFMRTPNIYELLAFVLGLLNTHYLFIFADASPMDPPSSPPLFDVSLKRGRSVHFADYDPSSDPATFSSDPPDASLDNYAQRSTKRQHFGKWWDKKQERRRSNPIKPRRRQSKFSRNFDSGVFMGSDGTDTSLPAASEAISIIPSYASDDSRSDAGHGDIRVGVPRRKENEPLSAIEAAQERVQEVLDHELEMVDLR